MEPSFHIQPLNIDTAGAMLFLEISAQGMSYIILDNGICVALVIYDFHPGLTSEATADNIHQIIADQPVLQQKFDSVHVIYSYEVSLLVPQEFQNDADNNEMLELLYSDVSDRITRAELMQPGAIYNVYGVPAVVDMVISRYFDNANFTHIFSLLPDLIKQPGNHLYCIFSTGRLQVMLLKEGKLQVMQAYSFTLPEDVAYHLLNICRSFDIGVKEIMLSLSGMIDANSTLYHELHKYFLQLQFESLPDKFQYPEEINQYPHHYFSHLFAIAACV